MKFRVERDILADAVMWTAKTLPLRPATPTLAGLRIEAVGGVLHLSSFDYEVSARSEVPADIETEGTVLVSGRLLADIAKSLPNQPVTFELDGSKVTVKCGPSKFTLLTMPVDDYPALPPMPPTAGTVGDDFADAIAQVTIAASRDDTLPLLTAVRVEVEGDKITMLATDRYRLGFQRVRPAQAPGEGFAAVIPVAVMARIRSTFKATRNTDPVINLTIDGTKLTVTTADALDGMVGATFEFALHNDVKTWPNVDRLLTSSLAAEAPASATGMLVNPALLADFRIGQPRYEALRATPTGNNSKPWLIRIGEDFIGLLVPMRSSTYSNLISDTERTGWLELLTAPEAVTAAAA